MTVVVDREFAGLMKAADKDKMGFGALRTIDSLVKKTYLIVFAVRICY